MVSGPINITRFPTSILAIAGYYTDSGGLQHVLAADDNYNVYQVTWDPSDSEFVPEYSHPPAVPLWQCDSHRRLKTIAAFFTPDDNYHHAVVTTRAVDPPRDYKLHEIYYKPGESPHIIELSYPISNSFEPAKGMAGFYSPCDNLRHVVVVDNNGNPVDITWNRDNSPKGKTITIPPTINQVASISSFLSRDENPNTRHIIVARNDTGEIYDIDYPDENHVYERTSFGELLKNVTAFFGSDTNDRHIVVLTQQNWLIDHAYSTYGANRQPIQLVHNDNIVDITSFYSARDQLRHVLYVTSDRNLHEITYTSQG